MFFWKEGPEMPVNLDWVLWLLAAICFGLGAFKIPSRIDLMLLGFMFIAITFLV